MVFLETLEVISCETQTLQIQNTLIFPYCGQLK